MSTHVRHDQEVLLESLLAGKLPRDLHWSEVLELVAQIGEVLPHGGNEFTFVVGSERAMFKRPHHDDVEMEEISRLRKFLKEASPTANSIKPHLAKRMIVLIDHHAAHIYEDVVPAYPKAKK
jgi:hypothetical protein